jgi:hypothetical protein
MNFILGYRLNEDFIVSVKNECAFLLVEGSKIETVTQHPHWIPVQDFIDTCLKPHVQN